MVALLTIFVNGICKDILRLCGAASYHLGVPENVNKINNELEGSDALLAEAVDQVLKDKKWSLSKAQIRTGVNRGTLNNMRHGIPVGAEHIVKFARAIAEPGEEQATVRRFLELSGKGEALLLTSPPPARDYLAEVGPDVDTHVLRIIPHSLGVASANPDMTREALGEQDGWLGERLPTEIRSIEVRGDCMEPYYQDGDILLVRETEDADSGRKVIALVDGTGITCKIYGRNGRPWLEPSQGEGRIEANRFRIIGVVETLVRPEKRTIVRH